MDTSFSRHAEIANGQRVQPIYRRVNSLREQKEAFKNKNTAKSRNQ